MNKLKVGILIKCSSAYEMLAVSQTQNKQPYWKSPFEGTVRNLPHPLDTQLIGIKSNISLKEHDVYISIVYSFATKLSKKEVRGEVCKVWHDVFNEYNTVNLIHDYNPNT